MVVKKPIIIKSALRFLLSALLFGQSLTAQSYIADITHISIEEGLSSNNINYIYQDKQGFIWVATSAGLNRYDGYSFLTYNTFNTPLFTNNNILGIYKDKEGLLWVGTSDGLTVLDPQGNVKKVYRPEPGNPNSLSDHRIRSIYQDRSGTIWIGTDNGTVDKYLGNDTFQTIYRGKSEEDKQIYGDNLNYNPINYIKEDSAGNLWIKDFYGVIFRLSRPTDTLTKNNNKGTQEPLWNVKKMSSLKAMGIDNQYNVWGLTDEALVCYDFSRDTFIPQTNIISRNPLNTGGTLIKSRNNNFWLVDKHGAAMIDFQSGIVTDYYKQNFYSYFQESVIEDLTGSLWITTSKNIVHITLKKNIFNSIPTVLPSSDLYNVYALTADKNGNIFTHVENHLIKVDLQTSTIDTLQKIEGIYYELMNEDSLLWAATRDGLCRIDKKKNTFTHFKLAFDTRFHTLFKRDSTTLWIGTGAGLFSFNRRQKRFTRIDMDFPRTSRVLKIIRSEKGIIWVAASTGLLKISKNNELLKHYNAEGYKKNGLLSTYLHTIYEDSRGILWLGSGGGGLIRFDPEKEKFTHYTKKDGLPNNGVSAITEYQGLLWISTRYGLSRFNPDTETFENYFIRDGLSSNAFNINSILRINKNIYLGSSKGITVFSPETLIEYQKEAGQNYNIPLIMTSFTKFSGKENKTIDLTHLINQKKEIALNYYDQDFNFRFSLADFHHSPAHEYAYMLQGLDENWRLLGNQPNINFPTLPFGRYTLRIKAKNAQGIWSEQQLAVPLSMNRIFYKTPAFIIIAAISGVIVVYLFFLLRLRKLKQAKNKLEQIITKRTREISQQKDKIEADKNTIEQQAEKLKELNATQARWFTNIAHELRTPLTLILGPIRQFLKIHSGKPETGIENIQLAEKNSEALLKLVNEILDVSKLDSRKLKLNKKPTSLTQLIRESIAHFDSFASRKDVMLTTHIPEDIELNIDKDHIRKILVNLVSNALKFTHAGGKVEVAVQNESKDNIKILVTDTGDGIPEKDLPHVFERYYQASDPKQINQGGTGIGLTLSLELARLHQGNLSVRSQPGKGSSFTLSLPKTLIISSGKSVLSQPVITHPGFSNTTTKPSGTVIRQQDKPLILLVEDNPDMRQYILGFMSRSYEVIEAADGLDALKFLKENSPDLIISDIMMPRMDGITLARTLKNDEKLKTIPFITLTAKAQETDKIATLRIGIDDYLTKPFNAEELEARATNLIRNYRERRAIPETDANEIAPTRQDKLVTAMKTLIMDRLGDNTFTVNNLADSQHMTARTLQRFLKKTTGLSPAQFIREIRLQEGRRLLEAKHYSTVLEVVHTIGFENASYFTRLFSERFGKKPSEYL